MLTDHKFEGWIAYDKDSAKGNLQWGTYEPKPFLDTDIDIAVTHCGVRGSDLSHLKSSWKPADYPLVVGHEIVGHVVRAGKDVKSIKVGDRVGVGAQSLSCLECDRCMHNQEQHCNKSVITYDARYADGSKANGGYAKYWRGSSDAPPVCAGITTYTPLKENGAGPDKRVGVIGIGGLGSFSILLAKALKADKVVAMSRTSSKREDALKIGADSFITTAEETNYATKYDSTLDLIICTVSGPNLPIADYISLLDVNGTFIHLGAPEDPTHSFSAFTLLRKNIKLGGSLIGSRKNIKEMLQLAADNIDFLPTQTGH
ncbi:related to alcohol dehydrogenase, class C [Fusarium oxysporum]|uniref:alcohol dehydrogenase (NADP(+)) n=1 Tax=Fusarium oxysporum TaxID=5507 RepID=A0A2H3TYI4_FUSOX|nr:related to alcohol dehydrogenase, class C [Fusarium oxysporum]